ncbi:MAG: radical SAM protein [Nitrospira sp.]|nr:radical SAM protein [Nitrospira sp.]
MKKSDFRVLLVYPNISMMLVTPLSIALFTWILKKEGFTTALFDTPQYGDGDLSSPQNRVKYLQARNIFSESNLKQLKTTDMETDFKATIENFKPNLIIYSFVEDGLGRALQLLRISNNYNITTVVGGILATSAPEWLISFPEVSIMGIDEGEGVVKDVAVRLFNGEDISDIPNLWIKRPDGSIKRNPTKPYVTLDDYSTDFSLFNEERFIRPMGGKIHRALPIETFRGCPNRCTYCNSPMHNKIAKDHERIFLRRRSTEGIRKELRHLVDDYGISLLYIIDDDFLARPKKDIDAFIEMYREFSLPFWFNTRPEHCSLDVLSRLMDVGLFRASFGIESGNEMFRKNFLGRSASNEDLIKYFDTIAKSGLVYSVNCIIGFPYETREMVFDTIRLTKRIKGYDAITVSIFTPYRGTTLRELAIKEGWLDSNAITTHTTATSMLNMPHFTPSQIDGLIRTFPLYVEFDESEWSEIEKAEFSEPGGDDIFARYSAMYRKRRWGETVDE